MLIRYMTEHHYYNSVDQLFNDWPIFDYTKEELQKIVQLSKERNEKLTIRIYGREYATFHPDGGIDPFEVDEIKKDGNLKMPPRHDKGVIYEFQFVRKGNFLFQKRKVKMRIKI